MLRASSWFVVDSSFTFVKIKPFHCLGIKKCPWPNVGTANQVVEPIEAWVFITLFIGTHKFRSNAKTILALSNPYVTWLSRQVTCIRLSFSLNLWFSYGQ